jgi:formylglycine-generating enzyme required for sulfatase activity
VIERVEQAAAAWDRMGRPRDLLWARRQLAEARALDRSYLPAREAAFLTRSATAIRRRRMIGAGVAAVLMIGAVVIGLAIRTRARRELEALVAAQTHAAMASRQDARQTAVARDHARSDALGLFDARHWSEGEDAWTRVEAMGVREEQQYRNASAHLESILLLDPARAGLRDWLAELTFERLLRAERDRRFDLAEEFASRLLTYDDGRHQTGLRGDAHIQLTVSPEGTRVWLERPGAAREPAGKAPVFSLTLPASSLVLVFEAPGHVTARLPILLARGETLGVRVALPALDEAPPGMIYVPPGRFLFGSADSGDARRLLFNTVPLHEITTPGYFIGKDEVTFAEWIEFLDDLPADERRSRSPRGSFNVATVALAEIGARRWRLTLTPTTRSYVAETGQRLHYEHRARRADQDWTRFPVSAVSYDDAIAYARWLDRTRRVPGARLCDEYEWERAARGADARMFPTGATLAPDDANLDVTYGREPLAFGPDEVGSHPASRSAVGIDDMAGNVYEWTRSVETPGAAITRGGCWYQDNLAARSANRAPSEPTQRHPCIGVRICATPREPPGG